MEEHQRAFLQDEIVVVEVALSAAEGAVAWETEAGYAAVVVQALQPRAALEQRHLGGGARSRRYLGAD